MDLHLGDGGLAHGRIADCEARDPLFGERGVEDTVRSELFPKADGAPEHASKRHVFPKRYLRRKKQEWMFFNTLKTAKCLYLYAVSISLTGRRVTADHGYGISRGDVYDDVMVMLW